MSFLLFFRDSSVEHCVPKSLQASRACHEALPGIHFTGLSTDLCLLGKCLFQHYQMWKESPFLLKCWDFFGFNFSMESMSEQVVIFLPAAK